METRQPFFSLWLFVALASAAAFQGDDVPGAPVNLQIRTVHSIVRQSLLHANQKRGFVADGVDRTCDDPVLLNMSGWYYDYNVVDPYRETKTGNCALANATGHLGVRFSPMNWCLSSLHADVPSYVNRTFFMGFNEPNNRHNCNSDARTVAKAWSMVMQRWNGTQLVSPATAGNGISWFDEFFGNCTELYGKEGCRISYLAAHDYSCTPSKTLAYLKELHTRYGYQVWLTEFSCGDLAQGRPTWEHLRFMRDVLPLLDAADYVYRYAWMSARDASSLRGLVETVDGKARLTELGQVWNNVVGSTSLWSAEANAA